ncbi:hypothetical protein BH23GEM9_BH23GEM9_00060 [soil metagenome]
MIGKKTFAGTSLPKQIAWAAVMMGAATLSGNAVRLGLDRAWRLTMDRKPPKDPSSRDVPWRDAILWTVATGAVVGLGQLLVRRGVEAGWTRFTGEEPPS